MSYVKKKKKKKKKKVKKKFMHAEQLAPSHTVPQEVIDW